MNAAETLAPWGVLPLPPRMYGELRSDHAGEHGAVMIYRGLLSVSRDPVVRAFAREHLQRELQHLAFFEQWLPRRLHSRVLPLWKLAGWSLGAIAALGGRSFTWTTIDAVETFVVQHYDAQLQFLKEIGCTHPIAHVLRRFRDDEAGHRDEARGNGSDSGLWAAAVMGGSRLAVKLARRF